MLRCKHVAVRMCRIKQLKHHSPKTVTAQLDQVHHKVMSQDSFPCNHHQIADLLSRNTLLLQTHLSDSSHCAPPHCSSGGISHQSSSIHNSLCTGESDPCMTYVHVIRTLVCANKAETVINQLHSDDSGHPKSF